MIKYLRTSSHYSQGKVVCARVQTHIFGCTSEHVHTCAYVVSMMTEGRLQRGWERKGSQIIGSILHIILHTPCSGRHGDLMVCPRGEISNGSRGAAITDS